MQPYSQLPLKQPQPQPQPQPEPIDQNHHSQFLESSHLLKISQIQNVYTTGLPYQSLVHAFHLAFNKTFVAQISFSEVRHYSAQGEVLRVFEITGKPISLLFMASPSLVILVAESPFELYRTQLIIQWDLETYQAVTFPFARSLTSTWFSSVFTESQMFCICSMEMNRYIPQKFELTYFKYPLKASGQNSLDQNPFHRMHLIRTNSKQTKKKLKMMKMNNKSMVGFIADQLIPDQSIIQILIYELNNQQGIWRTLQLKHSLQVNWNICSIRIADIYEIQPGKVYVKLGVEPDENKLTDQMDNQDALYKYEEEHDFIYNMKTAELKPAKFGPAIGHPEHFVQFLGQFRQQILQKQQRPYFEKVRVKNSMKRRKSKLYEYNLDYYQIPEYDETVNIKIQRQLCIYYVDPQSEEIVAKEARNFDIVRKNNTDAIRPKMFPVTTNPSLFIEYYEERKEGFKIFFLKVRKVKELLYSKEQIATFMLTQLVENPAEDLLSGVAALLETQEQGEWDWGREIAA